MQRVGLHLAPAALAVVLAVALSGCGTFTDNDVAGVTITPSGTTDVSEDGATDTYQIALDTEARSGGLFVLQHGTLYPVLHRLEAAKLVRSAWREAYEDVVWSLINHREFVWMP